MTKRKIGAQLDITTIRLCTSSELKALRENKTLLEECLRRSRSKNVVSLTNHQIEELVNICVNYVNGVREEQSTTLISDVKKSLAKGDNDSKHFSRLANGRSFGTGDVATDLRYEFYWHLNRILNKDGIFRGTTKQTLSNEAGKIDVGRELLSDLALAIHLTFDELHQKYQLETDEQSEHGRYYSMDQVERSFFGAVKQWLKTHDFQHGTLNSKGEPGPLATFIRELANLLPEVESRRLRVQPTTLANRIRETSRTPSKK